MKNFALLECTAEQLLSDEFDGEIPIYENDILTQVDGSLSMVHHRISKSQAKEIMRKIVRDDVIGEALREGLRRAILNPDGNMPVDGAHPVDPAFTLIVERAILPTLGALPPPSAVAHFVTIAYDNIQRRV